MHSSSDVMLAGADRMYQTKQNEGYQVQ